MSGTELTFSVAVVVLLGVIACALLEVAAAIRDLGKPEVTDVRAEPDLTLEGPTLLDALKMQAAYEETLEARTRSPWARPVEVRLPGTLIRHPVDEEVAR